MHFIYKPNFGNLTDQGLQYKDVLVYIGIRSFYNEQDKLGFPSYRTITKRVGCSIVFLRESIERLRHAGFLHVWKIGKFRPKHYYKFENTGLLTKIPFQIISTEELTVSEKATLAILREYCSFGKSYINLEDVSIQSGIAIRTLTSHFKSLLLKGYVTEGFFEDVLNSTIINNFSLTDKINWSWDTKAFYPSKLQDDNVLDYALKLIKASRTK
jgi:hypothetical protein